jgi:hypothetical protein
MLEAANKRENAKLEQDATRLQLESARVRMEEINQLLNIHKLGLITDDVLKERIALVEQQYAPRKRAHSPDGTGPDKRSRLSSSSDVGSSSQWDNNGSSPVPGSDRTLGFR